MSRQVWPDAPTYSCLLWLWTKVMGMGEIMLRISSVLPMLGAVYLLYRAARELFERDVALIAAIVFCLHPIIIFAAIDVRPYAFAALAINASILALVHLRHNNSNWLAALFGLSAACIVRVPIAVRGHPAGACRLLYRAQVGDRKTSVAAARGRVGGVCFGVPAGDSPVAIHDAHQRHACVLRSSHAAGIGLDDHHKRAGDRRWLFSFLLRRPRRRLDLHSHS